MRTEDDNEAGIEPTSERRPGAELARARAQAGIGLRAMADTLHLPESQVRALESDDYDRLPPPTFVRGYLRSYARVLGLDDDDIIAAYEALGTSDEDPELYLASGREASANNRGLALALVVLALAVGVSLGAWWWQLREPVPTADAGAVASGATAEMADDAGPAADESDDESTVATATESAAGTESTATSAYAPDAGTSALAAGSATDAVASEEGGAAEATPAQAGTESTSADGATADAAPDIGDAQSADDPDAIVAATSGQSGSGVTMNEDASEEPAGTGASSSDADGTGEPATTVAEPYDPPAVTASSEAATAPQAAEGPELLSVRVDGRTWIEISDARGRELVYTLYTGSAPLRLRGWPPFSVFLGNSPAVAIEFNGNAVEKSAFTRSDRTARFVVDADGARRR